MQMTETNLGYLIETPKVRVLFGGVKANLVNVQASFTDIEFVRVKQTHGDVAIETPAVSQDYQLEADAHFTSRARVGVCISTADCIPVFIFDEARGVVAGIHAGWRGVANRIVPKTIAKLLQSGSVAKDLQLFVGPHIQKESFEVSNDVRDELLQSASLAESTLLPAERNSLLEVKSSEKSLVDLNKILRLQLRSLSIEESKIFDVHLNTFSDPRFHSHRRDRERAGRQLSFICRV